MFPFGALDATKCQTVRGPKGSGRNAEVPGLFSVYPDTTVALPGEEIRNGSLQSPWGICMPGRKEEAKPEWSRVWSPWVPSTGGMGKERSLLLES